jgi:hypothetical protein
MSDQDVKGKPIQTDVSQRALRIARIIDRMLPGTYMLMLVIPERDNHDWNLEVFGAVRIQRYQVYKERRT